MATKKQKGSGKTAAATAATVLTAAAAAGAGYYFYASKHAKQHRRKAAVWAKGFKADVEREARKVDKLDKKIMNAVVDRVAKTYKTAKKVDAVALMSAAGELKDNWQAIQAEVGKARKTVRTAAKKAVKRPKKSAKKTAKKRARTSARSS